MWKDASDSQYILKTQLRRFSKTLEMWERREKKEKSNLISKFVFCASGRMKLQSSEMGKSEAQEWGVGSFRV